MFFKKAPHSVLVICTQRIGDVLLTTPLIHSFKKNWPHTAIDALVFQGTEEILDHNKDIRHILTFPQGQSFFQKFLFFYRLWNQYDLAVSIQPGDRPTFYAFIAGKKRLGALHASTKGKWWKEFLLNGSVDFDTQQTHTVMQNLKFIEKLGLDVFHQIKLQWSPQIKHLLGKKDLFDINQQFVILHTVPRFQYKRWHQQGWVEVAEWLNRHHFRVIFTGGDYPEEQEYIQHICSSLSFTPDNLGGKLSLTELSYLLSQAAGYVGVDTVTTHMAAASGIPTLALFGPTPPQVWGPWPFGCKEDHPFQPKGSQHSYNVTILQNDTLACVPCFQEGCDRHANSQSQCLNQLTSQTVIDALKFRLAI